MMRYLNVKEDGIYVIRIITTKFKRFKGTAKCPATPSGQTRFLRPLRLITMAAPNNNYKFYKSYNSLLNFP